ncbi:hypothetical protein [Roseovarius sp. C03]|uniref:hypothetical protein n=1 Tax=Roseovarius sp. C03 TaxID=3449222 RepID=UPI003EDB98A4
MEHTTRHRGTAEALGHLVRAKLRRHVSTIGVAGHGAGAFIALSIGAALRHYATGEIPPAADLLSVTAWGWPAGVPLYLAACYIARPLS